MQRVKGVFIQTGTHNIGQQTFSGHRFFLNFLGNNVLLIDYNLCPSFRLTFLQQPNPHFSLNYTHRMLYKGLLHLLRHFKGEIHQILSTLRLLNRNYSNKFTAPQYVQNFVMENLMVSEKGTIENSKWQVNIYIVTGL